MIDRLAAVDAANFYLINHGTKNAFFDVLMPIMSDLSVFFAPILVGWLLLVLSHSAKARVTAVVIFMVVSATEFLASDVLKPAFERPRPYHALSHVNLWDRMGKKWTRTGELDAPVRGESRSMPSAHATNIFGAAVFLSLNDRRRWPYFMTIAALVGFSRVYLGVHYPMDVIVGAAVGAGTGYLFYRLSVFLARWAEGPLTGPFSEVVARPFRSRKSA